MDNENHFLKAKEDVWEASYRLEVLGEMLAVEAQEIRHAIQLVEDHKEYLVTVGVLPDTAAQVEAVASKLKGDIEHELRYRIDLIRDSGRTLRHLAD